MTHPASAPAAVSGPAAGPQPSGPSSRVVVVTGMSGAGRSTALKALEDLGYEAVDNLPLSLVPSLVSHQPHTMPLAIGADVRTRDFGATALADTLDGLAREGGARPAVVFLDCGDERLVARFTETRRRHPLAQDRPVIDGIRLERQHVWPLRDRADLVIDTGDLSPADLKRILTGHFALDRSPGIALSVISFSYRHGLPRDADIVFDARFLRNPHYVPALKALSGLDPEVGAATAAAIRQLGELGARIEDVALSPADDYHAACVVIMIAEAFAIHEPTIKTRWREYGAIFRHRLMPGALLSGPDYVQATRLRRHLALEMGCALERHTALLFPTSIAPAPPIEAVRPLAFYERASLTTPANVSGHPALSVCSGYTKAGLPMGLQLVGRRFDEATLLKLGDAYERATPWRQRRPEL